MRTEEELCTLLPSECPTPDDPTSFLRVSSEWLLSWLFRGHRYHHVPSELPPGENESSKGDFQTATLRANISPCYGFGAFEREVKHGDGRQSERTKYTSLPVSRINNFATAGSLHHVVVKL